MTLATALRWRGQQHSTTPSRTLGLLPLGSLLCSGSNETHLLISSSAHQLFVDKDTIVNAVGTSHDIHLLKIDNREDELVTRVNSWCTHLVDKVSDLCL